MSLLKRAAEKFKSIIFTFIIVSVLLPVSVYSTAEIANLTVSPGTLAPGDPITISFDMRSSTNQTGRFAIAYSSDTTLDKCDEDWLVGDEIYNRNDDTTVNWWIDSVTQTAAGIDYAGDGPRTGITGPSTSTYQRVTIVSNVPPEKAGDFRIYVLARDNDILRYDCSSSISGPNNTLYEDITVSGATVGYKLDLQVCYSTITSDRLKLYYRVVNHSESGVRGNQVAVRYYMNQSGQSSGWSTANGNWKFRQADGTNDGNNYTMSSEFVDTSSYDCDDTDSGTYSRETNFYLRMHWNSSNGMIITPNGGYLDTEQVMDVINTGGFDTTDDYSRVEDTPSCYSQNRYVTLYYNDSTPTDESNDEHLCEYTSPDDIDNESGQEPCGIGCGATVVMQKSASNYVATMGDTLTFCITYTNYNSDSYTFHVWDTLPVPMTYIGCDSGCSRSFYGDTEIIWWQINTVPLYGSGTVCFYATVDGLPFLNYDLPEYFAWKNRESLYLALN